MKTYEGIFVFPPNVGPDERAGQEKNLEALIAKNEGKIIKKTEWGKRSLGYEIRKFKEGIFLLFDLEMPPANLATFRKAVELNPEILKYMVTVKDPRLDQIAAAKAAAAAAAVPAASKE